jgi:hypothetical protein
MKCLKFFCYVRMKCIEWFLLLERFEIQLKIIWTCLSDMIYESNRVARWWQLRGDSKFGGCRKFGLGRIQNLHRFSVRSGWILKENDQFDKFVHYRIRRILLNFGKIRRICEPAVGPKKEMEIGGMEEEQGPHTPRCNIWKLGHQQKCACHEGKLLARENNWKK